MNPQLIIFWEFFRSSCVALLLFVGLSLHAAPAEARLNCSSAHNLRFRLTTQFRPGPPDDLFLTVRANAGHFWAWINRIQHPAMTFKGVVAGDPHILNFDDVLLRNGRRDLVLTDFDDGAVNAPFLGDFIRLAVASQTQHYKVPVGDLFERYLAGLQGIETKQPKVVRRLREIDFEESAAATFKHVEKNSVGSRIRYKRNEIFPPTAVPADIRWLFHSVAPTFEEYLHRHHFRILDVAVRIKATGGSQNVPRILYLAEKDGLKSLVEFKMVVSPAAGIAGEAGNPADRFAAMVRLYGRSDVAPINDWIVLNGDQFHVREKQPSLVDFDLKKSELDDSTIEDGREVYLYLASVLGRAHGAQTMGAPLAQYLSENRGATKGLSDLVNEYIRILTVEQKAFERSAR